MRAGTRAHECVCVCAYTCAHSHTHTHTHSMARGLSYVPCGFPSCEQEDEGLKPIGLGAVAAQRGGLVVGDFSPVLSGPKMLWFRAGDRSLPVSCFSPCHCDLTSPPFPFYLWTFCLTSRWTTTPFKVPVNLQAFFSHFRRKWRVTQKVAALCADGARQGGGGQDGGKAEHLRTRPSQYNQSCTCMHSSQTHPRNPLPTRRLAANSQCPQWKKRHGKVWPVSVIVHVTTALPVLVSPPAARSP